MWPWGHFAVGYLLYAGYRRYRDRPVTGPAAVAVAVGTQFPDLVDKPLAWTVGVLEYGRSLAHSWLIAAIVLIAVWWWLGDERRALALPFAVGWFSHGIGDGLYSVLVWEPAYLGFILWPVTSSPPPEMEQSFAAHFLAFELDPFAQFQILLFVLALLVWRRDGYPGLGIARGAITKLRRAASR